MKTSFGQELKTPLTFFDTLRDRLAKNDHDTKRDALKLMRTLGLSQEDEPGVDAIQRLMAELDAA